MVPNAQAGQVDLGDLVSLRDDEGAPPGRIDRDPRCPEMVDGEAALQLLGSEPRLDPREPSAADIAGRCEDNEPRGPDPAPGTEEEDEALGRPRPVHQRAAEGASKDQSPPERIKGHRLDSVLPVGPGRD